MTWGAVLLATAALGLVVLAVTAPFIWWPGLRKWRNAFRLRWRKGRFARDFDPHNVIGIVAVVPLADLGADRAQLRGARILGALVLRDGWGRAPDENYTMEPSENPGAEVSLDDAIAAAEQRFPGAKATWVGMPESEDGFYSVDLIDGGPDLWAHNAGYRGNRSVGVDALDATNVRVFLGPSATVSNAIADEWAQPALHYGHAVNPYWRVLWFVLGLAPLLLLLTGLSTGCSKTGSVDGAGRPTDLRTAHSRDSGEVDPHGVDERLEPDALIDAVRCRVRQVGEQHDIVHAVAQGEICDGRGDGRSVATSTAVGRRENQPDPRHSRGAHTQHRHADRRPVGLPEHESVPHAVGGFDELVPAVVVDVAERFSEELPHPLHESTSVAVRGVAGCAVDVLRLTQCAEPIQALFNRHPTRQSGDSLPGLREGQRSVAFAADALEFGPGQRECAGYGLNGGLRNCVAYQGVTRGLQCRADDRRAVPDRSNSDPSGGVPDSRSVSSIVFATGSRRYTGAAKVRNSSTDL